MNAHAELAMRPAYGHRGVVAGLYQHGKALKVATHFAIDDVIDPADSRRWIASALRSTPVATRRTAKKYPFIDSW